MNLNKIGVLTSGEDAPGMNAAIRSVVRSGLYYGIEMVGIKYGFQGILDETMGDMKAASVGSIIQRGGTILQSYKSEEITTNHGQQKAIEILKKHGIDGLVVIGGRDALKVAASLAEKNYPCIGIPATIDNDIPFVEETIGFDTALNTIIEYVDRIRDTASSHEKSSIIEVMGRDTGDLALWSGLAGGAENILIPEKQEDVEGIVEKIKNGNPRDKRYSIIIVAEGCVSGIDLNTKLKEEAGIESRVTVLGHTQRGGAPTGRDRVLASRLGGYAVDLLLNNEFGKLAGVENNKTVSYPFNEVFSQKHHINESMYDLTGRLSI
ncbi:6-phosphofructokinase [Halobacillus karajensis]|uniref:ATP-dependent 6-phosphofructokinase n=1 Tax=Halobacillus karajensis TaxID=195088 RepID=A0A024P661_9BACI|nr:6-phosphofructokinase [Halobacillus karajensis]CDQ23837.1 6-phosphofructokinase [Halobacillus karajensis]CDQ27315.1 6-phosphofructokinase [Halobacillus karajensis]